MNGLSDDESPEPFAIPPVAVEFTDWLRGFYLLFGIFLLILITSRKG